MQAVTYLSRAIWHALCERLQEEWQIFLYIQQDAEKQGLAAPSTTPCSPAPNRQLLIVGDDVQAVPSAMFLSFDGILSSAGNAKANPYERHSSQSLGVSKASLGPMSDEYERSPGIGRKKWGILRSIMPFSSSTNSSDRKASSRARKSRSDTSDSSSFRFPQEKESPNGSPPTSYRSLSFKFALEWVGKDNRPIQKAQCLYPPKLPPLALEYMKGEDLDVISNQPCKPEGSAVGPSKYAGRALAEWALLIVECQNFFERRRAEGVPSTQLVEIPSLSVDPFRRV